MADLPVTPPGTPSAAPSAAAPAPAPRPVSEAGSSAPLPELEIHTIPDKFYGAALRATLAERQKDAIGGDKGASPEKPSGSRPAWFFPVIGGIAVLLFVAGGFVYFNRDLIFAKPAPAPAPVQETPPPPPPPEPPAAATNLTATTTALTVVHLSWTDVATDESSYRVERRDSTSSYAAIRNLAPNESSYDDPTVSPDTDYLYRVVAVNANGESASSDASVRTSPTPDVPPPPPTLPPAGLDSDSDGLTDLEEPLYGSPVNNPDADKDTYNDGNEVYHLYSPSGKAPGKLLESGLVKKIESNVGWAFYAPSPWQASVNEDGLKGAVLTGHGEAFIASVEDNPDQKPLLDWYLAQHPGVLSSQVTAFKTQSGFEGLAGADQLSAYFPWGNKVFVLRYNLDGKPFVNFRTTFEMMKNSLVLTVAPLGLTPTAPAAVPPPTVEPTPPAPAGPDPVEEPFEIGNTGETP
jgi:hypothetical protein